MGVRRFRELLINGGPEPKFGSLCMQTAWFGNYSHRSALLSVCILVLLVPVLCWCAAILWKVYICGFLVF